MHRILFCLFLCSAVMPMAAAADSSIGVLYIERVFEESNAVNEVRLKLRDQADKIKATLGEMTDQVEAIEAEIETLPQGAPARFAATDKLEVLRLQRKLYAERNQSLLSKVEVDLLKTTYSEIRTLLATFAAERGISTVLLGSHNSLGATNLQELNLELATHSVLYHAPYLDISTDFLAYIEENLDLKSPMEAPAPDAAAPGPAAGDL